MYSLIQKIYRNIRRLLVYFEYKIKILFNDKVIENIIKKNIHYHLFITNDNGGGTKQYENNVVDIDKDILILRRISYGERKDVLFELNNVKTNETVYLWPSELPRVFKYNFSLITINTLVHVSTIQDIINYIVEYKEKNPDCKLLYLVHDFNSVCINCNLFVNEKYCSLDCENKKCKLCLADEIVNINEWRNMWLHFLKAVDEVRCFSDSSKIILEKVYPQITNKITVVPHDTSFIKFKPIKNVDELQLHLGFIGACDAAIKGKKIAEEIIRLYGDIIPITFIGTTAKKFKAKGKLVNFTGKYDHEDLQDIIEQEKVSCIVFGGGWP